MSLIRIGIIIADEGEFAPVREVNGAEKTRVGANEAYRIDLACGENRMTVTAVLCGIGKVNASAAAALVCADGADYIISTGYSGGLGGSPKGGIVLSDRLYEHDFDLVCLGYKPGEKPGEQYGVRADERLLGAFRRLMPEAEVGAVVSGDCFVSDAERSLALNREFGAAACDMESAAVASVCARMGVGFIAVRKVSDSADEGAADSYREMNALSFMSPVNAVLTVLTRLCESPGFFSEKDCNHAK